MKIGFESEKILYQLQEKSIYHGVFRLVDALSDYVSFHGEDIPDKVSNEFVLNMVEMNTIASPSQREVVEDYLLLYQIVRDVSSRDNVVPLPLSAVPFHFTPTMVPKWAYYVQNSILSGKRLKDWALLETSPLADAGNCAGLHAHFEIEALPEFLMFDRELCDKHNMGLMLTPMVAFASSPYFLSDHSAHSMRGKRYYYGVYANHPLNGGLPPVFKSSEEVLRYTHSGLEHWIGQGTSIGFKEDDLRKLIVKKGANWSMVRWNRTWNTIELRCLESDRIDYDVAKFIWVAGAMKRLDLKGEALKPVTLPDTPLSQELIEQSLQVTETEVTILPTQAIHDLTNRAIQFGLSDALVECYLKRLAEFARPGVDEDCMNTFAILERVIESKRTTSALVLEMTGGTPSLTQEKCLPHIEKLIEQNSVALKNLRADFPTAIPKDRASLFPSFTKRATKPA